MHTNFSTTAAHESGAPPADAPSGWAVADVASALDRLDAGSCPYARMEVEVGTAASIQLHHGWIGHPGALVVDLGDQGADLVEVDLAFLPAAVARLTRLRQRPRLAGRGGRVDRSVLDVLVGPIRPGRQGSAAALAAAAAPWPDVAACLESGAWRLCAVDVADSRTGSTETAQVSWLDTPAGVLRVDDDPAGPVLAGTSAEAVWQAVLEALPSRPALPGTQSPG